MSLGKLATVCLLLAAAGCSQPNLVFQKLPWEQADYYCSQGQPVAAVEKKEFCKSDRPLLFDNPSATFPVPILFDESGGTGKGYDRLYVDFDGDGNFLDDPVYTAAKGEGVPDRVYRASVSACFRNVHLVHNRQRKRFAHVQVVLLSYVSGDGTAGEQCVMIPQRWAVGTVTVAGKTLPAALVDRNWNDCVTDPAGLNLKEHPQKFPRGDYLILGIDGEKSLRPGDSYGRGGSARGILTEHLVLNSGVYEVQAEQTAGGVRLELLPAKPPMGKLKLPAGRAVRASVGADGGVRVLGGGGGTATTGPSQASRLVLIGTKTCVLLRNPAEVISVPADTYFVVDDGTRTTFTVEAGKTAEAGKAAQTIFRQPEVDDGRF